MLSQLVFFFSYLLLIQHRFNSFLPFSLPSLFLCQDTREVAVLSGLPLLSEVLGGVFLSPFPLRNHRRLGQKMERSGGSVGGWSAGEEEEIQVTSAPFLLQLRL